MVKDIQEPLNILKRRQVQVKTGLSRSNLYRLIKLGLFPRQISLGPRAVGWIQSEVESWLRGQVEQSRNRQAQGGLA